MRAGNRSILSSIESITEGLKSRIYTTYTKVWKMDLSTTRLRIYWRVDVVMQFLFSPSPSNYQKTPGTTIVTIKVSHLVCDISFGIGRFITGHEVLELLPQP